MDERIRSASDRTSPRARIKYLVFGAMLIVGGIVLAVNGLTIFDAFALWPLVLVGLGAGKVLGGCCAGERRSGAWLLAIGLWFAINQFTVLGYHDTWPLLVVAVGALIVWDAAAPADRCPACAEGRHAD